MNWVVAKDIYSSRRWLGLRIIWSIIKLLFGGSVVSYSLQPYGLQHAELSCPSLSPGAYLNHVHWVHDAVQSPHLLLPPSPPALIFPSIKVFSRVFFTSGGQSIGPSPSPSVLPMNIQGWFPLGMTGLISFLFKGLSWVFSSFRKTDILFLMSFILFLSS